MVVSFRILICKALEDDSIDDELPIHCESQTEVGDCNGVEQVRVMIRYKSVTINELLCFYQIQGVMVFRISQGHLPRYSHQKRDDTEMFGPQDKLLLSLISVSIHSNLCMRVVQRRPVWSSLGASQISGDRLQ